MLLISYHNRLKMIYNLYFNISIQNLYYDFFKIQHHNYRKYNLLLLYNLLYLRHCNKKINRYIQ
jgi:hypothetical protein